MVSFLAALERVSIQVSPQTSATVRRRDSISSHSLSLAISMVRQRHDIARQRWLAFLDHLGIVARLKSIPVANVEFDLCSASRS